MKHGWEDSIREIDLGDETKYKPFYDGIVERIKDALARRPQDLAEKTLDSKPIGFKLEA